MGVMPDCSSTPVETILKIELASKFCMYSVLDAVRWHFELKPFVLTLMSTPRCSDKPTVRIRWSPF